MNTKKAPQPIGTCAILINSEGEILLGKRKNSYKAGMYGLPGGRIELNESIEQAVAREVEEETGFKKLDFTYVGVVRENQGEYDFIHFVFLAKVEDQQPTLCEPDKCEGWKWLNPTEVKDEILLGHWAGIEMWQENEKLKDVVT